jgi:hypothetical protein
VALPRVQVSVPAEVYVYLALARCTLIVSVTEYQHPTPPPLILELVSRSRLLHKQHRQPPYIPTTMSKVLEITRPDLLNNLLSQFRVVVINCKERPVIYEANFAC